MVTGRRRNDALWRSSRIYIIIISELAAIDTDSPCCYGGIKSTLCGSTWRHRPATCNANWRGGKARGLHWLASSQGAGNLAEGRVRMTEWQSSNQIKTISKERSEVQIGRKDKVGEGVTGRVARVTRGKGWQSSAGRMNRRLSCRIAWRTKEKETRGTKTLSTQRRGAAFRRWRFTDIISRKWRSLVVIVARPIRSLLNLILSSKRSHPSNIHMCLCEHKHIRIHSSTATHVITYKHRQIRIHTSTHAHAVKYIAT